MSSTTRTVQRSRRVRRIVIATLALAVTATVGMAATHAGVFASSASHTARSCAIAQGPGLPGITPTRPCQVPSFTTADVIAYYHLQLVGGVYTQVSGVRPGHVPEQLVSIQFLTTAQVDVLLQTQLDRPPTYLLCLVQFRGQFDYSAIGAPGGVRISRVMTHSLTVYDATTGNVVARGMDP